MKKYIKLVVLLLVLMCTYACTQHPTGNPKEDAATYHKMLYSGDVQGANQFADEVRDLYLQDFINDRGAKLDEFWEWNAKMK
ncbi:MAG: hypothetical protein J6U65_05545 [Bacteroidaceae bacterium]|nr:hypothetical protein [Bacteroidaceae bacterium]